METATVRHILKKTAEDIPSAHPALFARIEESIGDFPLAGKEQHAPSSSPVQDLFCKLRGYFSRPQLAWGVVAVQAIALCLFVAYSPVTNTYQTLSADRADTQVTAEPIFYVIFHGNAQLGEIEQLLTRSNAAIINGPGKRGIYTIRVHPELPMTVKEVLTTLEDSSLIMFIEQAY